MVEEKDADVPMGEEGVEGVEDVEGEGGVECEASARDGGGGACGRRTERGARCGGARAVTWILFQKKLEI